ncbi:hypothetical protein [Vibrio aestuarianus]|uniref:Uncharacterized protein n=1 Tax=Vibrio aestuarianus TaxID=28171 RepID=A0A9X4IV46_9VIBR|nr:hypothetical protein [Vibrio aestuarianus]MDE1244244.1 hypothetical protein [Vibrio aestuarianus]
MSEFKYEIIALEGSTEIDYRAYFDGKACDLSEVSGHIAKRRASLQLILADIRECHEILNSMRNHEELSSHLYKAFVITYSKCFASGAVRGLSLDSKRVYKSAPDLLKLHDHVYKMRNTYIAHADNSACEQAEVYFVKHENISEVFVPTSKYSAPWSHSFEELFSLINELYAHVAEQTRKVDSKITEQFA